MKDKCQLVSIIDHHDGKWLTVSFIVTTEDFITCYKYSISTMYKHKIEIKYKRTPFKALNLCKAQGELIGKGIRK